MRKKLIELSAWKALKEHYKSMQRASILSLQTKRQKLCKLSAAGWTLDYSRQPIADDTLALLIALANESELASGIKALFQGKKINFTENRSVLHTALRAKNPPPEVQSSLKHMEAFVQAIRTQQYRGYTGQPIKHIVNIGIGGSDLGPAMLASALKPYADRKIEVHFISNIDGASLSELFKTLIPDNTLFVVASKTFTTLETMANAQTARSWIQASLGNEAIPKHFVAVTAAAEKAKAWGILEDNIFAFWEWVGGRFSVWSAIGLPIALYLGMEHFKALLQGAEMMDQHFREAPFEKNMPVLLALLGIWLINFYGAQSYAIIPYEQSLHRFPAYLQQLDMESNGKSVNCYGERVSYATAPVIFGEPGTNSQHAFHQLFYQGTHYIPVDIIFALQSLDDLHEHRCLLIANAQAQAQALAQGKSHEAAMNELLKAGYSFEEAKSLTPHKVIEGDKPSLMLTCETISPKTMGALIALYEHKVFVQGCIWQINSFDQFGVELGKQLLKE